MLKLRINVVVSIFNANSVAAAADDEMVLSRENASESASER